MAKKYPRIPPPKHYHVQVIDLLEHSHWMVAWLSRTNDLNYAKRRARQYHRDFPTSIVRVWDTYERKVWLLLPETLLEG